MPRREDRQHYDVIKLSVSPHHTIGIDHYGSNVLLGAGILQSVDSAGVAKHIASASFTNLNRENRAIAARVPASIRLLSTQDPLSNHPHGFLQNFELAEQMETEWAPGQEAGFRERARMSAQYGYSQGHNSNHLSCSGHLPLSRRGVALGKRYFGEDCQHLSWFFDPKYDRALWPNLQHVRNKDFPDEVETPIVIVDNGKRKAVDRALPAWWAMVLAGAEFTAQHQRSVIEIYEQIRQCSKVMGMAAAQVQMPLIKLTSFQKFGRWLRDQSQQVLAEQIMQQKTAELITNCLLDSAKLGDYPNPDADAIQFMTVSIPKPHHGTLTFEEVAEYEDVTRHLVGVNLRKHNQIIPRGLRLVWSSFVGTTADEFVVLPAVRLYPIPVKTVRELINPYLK